MANTLKLEIVTPEGTVYSEDVEMVTLPGVAGQMGVYPQHVPLMTQMVPGEIIVRKDGRDMFIATGEGAHRSHRHRVAILTDLAVPADRIDEAKAEEARQRAEARLGKNSRTRKSLPSTPRWLAPWPNCASSAGSTSEAGRDVGLQQKAPIGADPGGDTKGSGRRGVKGKIVEKKVAELKDYMERVEEDEGTVIGILKSSGTNFFEYSVLDGKAK